MNPDSPVSISWDYVVELSDDGAQPTEADPEVVTIPPPPQGTEPTPNSSEEKP